MRFLAPLAAILLPFAMALNVSNPPEIAVKDAKTNKYTAAVVYQVSDEWSRL